jgi:hypothetical protein
MKKHFVLLLTAVAALTLLAGCERNNNPADDEGGKNFPEDGNIPRKLVLLFSEHTPYLEATEKEVSIMPYTKNTLGKIIPLPSVTTTRENEVVSYDDVSLPVGASSALVYAKAIEKDTPISSPEDKFKYGILDVTGLSGTPSPDDVRFSPVPVYTGVSEKGTQLIAILNAVADVTPESVLSDGTKPHFKEVTEDQSVTINSLWKAFKEIPIASSLYVGWTLKELYLNLDGLATDAAHATVPDGYSMAVAIRTLLDNYMDVAMVSGVTVSCTLKSEYHGFPGEVHLPDGALGITYNPSSRRFEAKPAVDYIFPASRQYFADSPLRETQDALPSGFADEPWDDILNAFSPGAVKRSSVAVAVEKPVRPAIAELAIQVDGMGEHVRYYDFAQNEVDVTNGFQATGFLVGGQKTVSGFFIPVGTKEYTTYNASYAGTTAESATVKRKQPLAKPWTVNLLPSDRSSIHFALEFINNAPDFVGADGQIIPNGAVFYIPGTLKSSDGGPLLTIGAQLMVSAAFNPETTLAYATLDVPDLNTTQDYEGSFDIIWPGR